MHCLISDRPPGSVPPPGRSQMPGDGFFMDPDIHAWVDLPTNFASLPGVRREHVTSLLEGRIPSTIVNTVMHEMTHHWCFFSPVGEVLALLKYRVRHALLATALGQEIDQMDVACDLVRYEVIEKALSPIIEGLALFMEHDAGATGSDAVYCRPLHLFSVFILQNFLNADRRFINLLEVDQWLQKNRTLPTGVKRKVDLLSMPLDPAKSIYLSGYPALKSFVISGNKYFGGSYDKLLGYLRSYFFGDYGLIDVMFGDVPEGDDPIIITERISNYLIDRMRDLFKRDLAADVSEWSASEGLEKTATVRYSDDIELGDGLIYPLRINPARGIGLSAEAAARGYSRHRDLFRVLDTSGEGTLLEAHKRRGLQEILNRSLMPICSECVAVFAMGDMVEARDAEGHTVARMKQLRHFNDGREGLIDFFFIPTESIILGVIFVDGAAVAFSSHGESEKDLLFHVGLLQPTPKQLEAIEHLKTLDGKLIRERLAGYDSLISHVRRQYARMQDAIYRPAVSMHICAPDANWRKVLSLLDNYGLVSVLDTRIQVLDVAKLSLLASRPRKPAELEAEFAKAPRDFSTVMALIHLMRNNHGLELMETTTDDQIVSVI